MILLGVAAAAVWRTGERHRKTADEALQDQASFYAGMISAGVQQQGWFAARTMLRAWAEVLTAGQPWPSTDSVRRRALNEAIGPDMPDLIPRRFFAGDGSGWRTTDAFASADDPILARVSKRSRDTLPPDGLFRMLVIPAGADTSLVFLMGSLHPKSGLAWYGFETPVSEFRNKIVRPRVVGLGYSFRLLRDSLHQQQPTTDSMPPLAIAIVSTDHLPLYSTLTAPHPPWIATRWITGGLAALITLSIEPAAVPVLMQGGYPTNPVAPILAAFAFGLLLLALAARLAWKTLAVSRQREEFAASVSHEMRTPLTNIQLFAETLLLDRAQTADEQRSALETITRETRHLVRMVENILALSRVGRPTSGLIRRPERVNQLVRNVVALFDPVLRSHDMSIELLFEGREMAQVDGDAVRRILVNIIDNAVRHGPDGQTLRITAANHVDQLELTVEDEGPGIPKIDRERIWLPFERGSTTVGSGTGLGLAVVRQLVSMHGGTARLEDGQRGARFVVLLPAADAPEREIRVGPST